MVTSKTILVIDDAEANVNALLELLEDEYDMLGALDGEDALEILHDEKVDLILLDIMMPGIDGFEVCRRLKANEKTKDIPVIFITAKTDEDSIEKAYEIGGVDYINKPFRAREVISRIHNHLFLAEQKANLEQNLRTNITLLNQYKEVVDKGTIVSKTDLKGRITYANDAFCKISGYSREELIGKPHNIVRHPDTPSEVYKILWDTIRHKNTWRGEIKNKKKDGGYYFVKSVVMPILDNDGNITEFISVRHDITDIYNLKKEIVDTQREVVFTMGAIGETRSKETGNHVKRVAEYSRILAKHIGMNEENINLLVDASPMHDIGKIAIHDNILHKPARLTDEEFVSMRQHAEIGYRLLAHSERPLLKTAATIAFEHHERWDGQGYPRHLKQEEISIEARITAVADVFDALGSDRVYKEAWCDEKIFEYFHEQREKQFDPHLVDVFFENLDEFLAVREEFKDV